MTTIESAPSEATARVADGTILRTLRWRAAGEPWAAALIVHGLGEHGGRYGSVARALTAAGIDVHAYDHRGFGGSAGPRAHVERWGQLLDDLEERLAAMRAEYPALPVVMYGHSMGGLVGAGYVLSDRPRPLPDLLVLSAPGIDAEVPAWKRRLASVLTNGLPRMKISNGLAEDGLSRDPSVRALADADPLCLSSSTIRFGAEAFAEQARVKAAIDAISSMPVPTYVLHGSDDPIVPVGVTVALGSKGNVERRVHEGLRHECHNEPERDAVLAEVVAWIRATAPVPDATGAGDRILAGAAGAG
jgi:alpha-beta hydrolase superfamily lysophospholipase